MPVYNTIALFDNGLIMAVAIGQCCPSACQGERLRLGASVVCLPIFSDTWGVCWPCGGQMFDVLEWCGVICVAK